MLVTQITAVQVPLVHRKNREVAMASNAIVGDVKLNNLLYLTDFSEPAEAALPFVTALARDYGSKISVCHILLPNLYACMAPEFSAVVSAGLEE